MATREDLVRQSQRAAQGRGGDQGAHHELPGAGVYELGIPDQKRFTAYYPPTRETWKVTPFVKEITWTDDSDAQYKTGTALIDNSGGEAARQLLRPGIVIFVETRPQGAHRFREFERFIFVNPEATDLSQAELTVDIADHGYFAANDGTRRSWHYHHDKHHPKGWRADQIAADVCRRMGIPVKSLVKGTYHIRRFVLHQATAMDAIAKAYAIDQNKTGRHYLLTYDRGLLLAKRIKRRNVLLAVDERDNARVGSFRREFPKLYASAVQPAGHRKTSDGKHHRHHPHKARASDREKASSGGHGQHALSGPELAVDALYSAGFRGQPLVYMGAIAGRETGGTWDPTVVNLKPPDHSIGMWQINQLAHHGRFGTDQELKDPYTCAEAARSLYKIAGYSPWVSVHYRNADKYIPAVRRAIAKLGNSIGTHRHGKSSVAKRQAATAARMLFGTLTYRPNIEDVGDPDYKLKRAQDLADFLSRSKKTLQLTCDCNMLIDRGDRIFVRFTVAKRPIRREVYVSSVTKTLSPGDATMDLTCVWQAKEVDVQTDVRIDPKAPKPAGAAGAGGKGAIDFTGSGRLVAATIYGIGEPGTGHTGAYGDNLNTHPWSYAELGGTTRSSANLLGGLPYMTALRITNPHNGKSVVAYKRDIGLGQGSATLQGHRYAIDLWGALAHKLGITGSQLVRIQVAR